MKSDLHHSDATHFIQAHMSSPLQKQKRRCRSAVCIVVPACLVVLSTHNEATKQRRSEGATEQRNEGTKERRNEGTNEGRKERSQKSKVKPTSNLTRRRVLARTLPLSPPPTRSRSLAPSPPQNTNSCLDFVYDRIMETFSTMDVLKYLVRNNKTIGLANCSLLPSSFQRFPAIAEGLLHAMELENTRNRFTIDTGRYAGRTYGWGRRSLSCQCTEKTG